jgi:type IV pilus assembly protein PilX
MAMHHTAQRKSTLPPIRQRGASLITVMLILIVVSALGIGAVQISIMGERSARNDRDMQVAWQATEAALMDAQFDIQGNKNAAGGTRSAVFGSAPRDLPMVGMFSATCGTAGNEQGLCSAADVPAVGALPVTPAWLLADFTSANTPSVEFGTFTGAKFPNSANKGGVRSARSPRYLIELMADYDAGLQALDKSKQTPNYMYRITSMGFGPREDIQAVAQMLLRP